ncbi:Protein kinase protein rad53 [Recurvomyces mirabilis]|nr:Protein kinase protein rad53 [Recurvomyces mirabilis]
MALPVFCRLELHNVNDEVFDRDANAQYLVDEEFPVVKRTRRASERVRLAREGTPVPTSRTIQLRLDPASMGDVDVGHVFGNAAEYCDVLLDTTNGNEISGMHFRVQLDYACIEPERLLIRNISRANELFVNAVPYRSDEYKLLSPGTHAVHVGLVHIVLTYPRLQNCTEAWNKLLEARKRLHGPVRFHRVYVARKPTPVLRHRDLKWTKQTYIAWETGKTYTIGSSIIASGTTATIRLATDRSTGEVFAVKIIAEGGGSLRKLEESCEMQRRELAVWRSLQHANVVRLVDFAVYQAQPYATLLLMELAKYQTLHEHQKLDEPRTILAERETIRIMKQLLSALAYLHEQNIIHRDVKPDNILIFDKDPASFTIKLTDFTIAHHSSLAGLPKDRLGSVDYRAIECAQGLRSDHRADIYSSGRICFRLLTGSTGIAPPLALDNAILIRALQMWDPAVHLEQSGVSIAARDLISAMLRENVGSRPDATECRDHEWLTLPDGPVTSELPSLSPSPLPDTVNPWSDSEASQFSDAE